MESMETENLGASFALKPNRPFVPTKASRATWAGLFISLFAMVVIRQVFVFFVPEITFASALHRPRHCALVEVDPLGLCDHDCIGNGRWHPGLSHWLRSRSGLCRV